MSVMLTLILVVQMLSALAMTDPRPQSQWECSERGAAAATGSAIELEVSK